MSLQAVKLVQYTEGLTLAEYVVLISLASLAGKDDWRCWPSLTALAEISNVEKKTAIHAIQRLTAPYMLPDPRPLVSLVENSKVKVRNHTYELNVPLLRELREKRRKRVVAMRSNTHVGVSTTPMTADKGRDIKGPKTDLAATIIEFEGGPGVFELPLPGFRQDWVVTREFYDELKIAYPRISIMRELFNIYIWLFACGRDRKTAKNLPTFVRNWMEKAQNRPRGRWYGDTEKGREEGKTDTLPESLVAQCGPDAGDSELIRRDEGEARQEDEPRDLPALPGGHIGSNSGVDRPSLFPRRRVQQVLSRVRNPLRIQRPNSNA